MTLGELMQLVMLKLGEQTAFYTPEEVVASGLSPAERLLCLAYPRLCIERALVTFEAEQPFLDLRTVASGRIRKLQRVILGDITGEPALRTAATGELLDLKSVSLRTLDFRPHWLTERGEIRRYWRYGRTWLGLYKRPIATTSITLVFEAMPAPFDMNEPAQLPSIPQTYHGAIADLAAGLLLIKEGGVEGQRGLQLVSNTLGLTPQRQQA